ncbi:MAG: hypothetical protein ACKV2T_33785 [Kofleriaceae bacterium]
MMRALAMVLGLGLASCGSAEKKSDAFDEILVQLEKFKTEMCACTDAACADRVSEARREFKKTMRDRLAKDAKPTAEQDRKGKAFETELRACRTALLDPDGSGAGSADVPE